MCDYPKLYLWDWSANQHRYWEVRAARKPAVSVLFVSIAPSDRKEFDVSLEIHYWKIIYCLFRLLRSTLNMTYKIVMSQLYHIYNSLQIRYVSHIITLTCLKVKVGQTRLKGKTAAFLSVFFFFVYEFRGFHHVTMTKKEGEHEPNKRHMHKTTYVIVLLFIWIDAETSCCAYAQRTGSEDKTRNIYIT